MQVCPSTGRPCDCSDGQVINSSEDKQVVAELKHEKPPQEPIFPPELRKRQASELCLAGPLATWHRSAFHVHQLAECIHSSELSECVNALELYLLGPLATWSRSAFHVDMLSEYIHAIQQVKSVCASELCLMGPLQPGIG